MRRKLLWCGDAVVATGFARATHKVLDVLKETWDVSVLGINYHGDPHDYPYPIFPASEQFKRDDPFGVRRLPRMVQRVRPDVVVLLNDPWNIPRYLDGVGNVPAVGWIAVDGKNCRGRDLNGLAAAVFWTEFAMREAAEGGYQGRSGFVPLGVDRAVYYPRDKADARFRMGLPTEMKDGFIFGNVNRNQPRKRLDLTIRYFARWLREYKVEDAFLFLHVAPTGDQGYDCNQMAHYYGVANHMIVMEPPIGPGVPEENLAITYSAFDAQISTTQGEGFGLTTLEGMACGIPQIVPDWSALGEICQGAALMVPCTSTSATPNNINAIGGVADEDEFIACLDRMYREPGLREQLRSAGAAQASRDRYQWPNIGAAFGRAVESALSPTKVEVADDDQFQAHGPGAGEAVPGEGGQEGT